MGSELTALLERVEKAAGPDRELDRAVAFAVQYAFPGWPSFAEHEAQHDYETAFVAHQPWLLDRVPAFTASIDAALALVAEKLPGWHWTIHFDAATHRHPNFAQITIPRSMSHMPAPWPEGHCDGATPALAVIAALLTTLIAQQAKESTDGR